MRIILTFTLSAALTASAVLAQANTLPGLQNEDDINSGLLVISIADKIRRECGDISARIFKAQSYARAIKSVASERGYTDDQIDEYIEDKTEKAKMRERRNEYFFSKGASNLDPNSLCVLGREEIAKNSQIGVLLRAK